jgi:tetratricopeptide (TPR) repeat protein
MLKKSLAEKIAKKSFKSAKFQKNWQVHMNAFGAILEPAFKESFQAKIHLTAALNEISNGKAKQALEKLTKLEEFCECNADNAARAFFMGLCAKTLGDTELMLKHYEQAEAFGHRLYLPYLDIAKTKHNNAEFEKALKYYDKAINYIKESKPSEFFGTNTKEVVLAFSYTNLASCLTMMHKYDEAEAVLAQAETILPFQPVRSVTKSILYAAMGRVIKMEESMETLKNEAPAMYEQTKVITDEIVRGENAQFGIVKPNNDEIKSFWVWFTENENKLFSAIESGETGVFSEMICPVLAKPFAFLKRTPVLHAKMKEGRAEILLEDFYSISLAWGYSVLIDDCPDEMKARWSFEIVH